jgi:ankyrin repeat protein
MTPLMITAKHSSGPDIISALLRAGADGRRKSNAGKTAFDYIEGNSALLGTRAYHDLGEAMF